jgi:hypothetical protein
MMRLMRCKVYFRTWLFILVYCEDLLRLSDPGYLRWGCFSGFAGFLLSNAYSTTGHTTNPSLPPLTWQYSNPRHFTCHIVCLLRYPDSLFSAPLGTAPRRTVHIPNIMSVSASMLSTLYHRLHQFVRGPSCKGPAW